MIACRFCMCCTHNPHRLVAYLICIEHFSTSIHLREPTQRQNAKIMKTKLNEMDSTASIGDWYKPLSVLETHNRTYQFLEQRKQLNRPHIRHPAIGRVESNDSFLNLFQHDWIIPSNIAACLSAVNLCICSPFGRIHLYFRHRWNHSEEAIENDWNVMTWTRLHSPQSADGIATYASLQ